MANDINQFMVTEGGRIVYDIYRREQHSSPWISQPKKLAWPDGIGETFDNIMWERPYVADAVANAAGSEGRPTWGLISFNNGQSDGDVGGSCIPPVSTINFSQTLRRTALYQTSIQSPRFCVTDLLLTAKRDAQMRNVEWGLGDMVRLFWINWNRDGFTRWSKKYIIDGSLQNYTDETDGLVFPQTPSTSRLTNSHMTYFRHKLNLEQGRRHALSFQNGAPVYGLITDDITSQSLTREADVREDFRYAKADMNLEPLGISHTYAGFIHMLDDMPNRYNFTQADASDSASDPSASDFTDAWEWVDPYILIPQDDGSYRKEVNPDWLTAEYQDSYIYVRDAYQLRVPASISAVSRAKFDPQMYLGDVQWKNSVNLDATSPAYNPDGKLGFFRGVMTAGVEPINPHVMYTLRHKVCTDISTVLCPGESA